MGQKSEDWGCAGRGCAGPEADRRCCGGRSLFSVGYLSTAQPEQLISNSREEELQAAEISTAQPHSTPFQDTTDNNNHHPRFQSTIPEAELSRASVPGAGGGNTATAQRSPTAPAKHPKLASCGLGDLAIKATDFAFLTDKGRPPGCNSKAEQMHPNTFLPRSFLCVPLPLLSFPSA